MKRVTIDIRPMPIIIAEKIYKPLTFLAALTGTFFLLNSSRLPEGLSREGYTSLLIFAFTVFFWVLNLVPPVIPAVFSTLLLYITKTASGAELLRFYSHPAVFFLLCALLLTGALIVSGGGKIISSFIFRLCRGSLARLFVILFFSSAFLSFLFPEHAVSSLFLPIVMEIIYSLKEGKASIQVSRLLLLSLAWGSITGGIATYLGGARNLLAAGILEDLKGVKINFFQWLGYSIIPSLIIIFCAFFILSLFFAKHLKNVERVEILKEVPPLSFKGILVLLTFFIIIIFWIRSHSTVELAFTGLAGVILLFFLGLVKWGEVEDTVNWSIFFMYGGCIALSSTVHSTGLGNYLAEKVISFTGQKPLLFILLISFLCILLTEGMSNSAVVATTLPVALEAGTKMGIHPVPITIIVALSSGLAFILPSGTPAMALAQSTGHLSIKDVFFPGLILILIVPSVMTFWFWLFWG